MSRRRSQDQEVGQARCAGRHPASHFDLAQALLVHRSLNLSGDDPFDCGRADFLIEAFIAKPRVWGCGT
jgi:hypothetical protein